jgi:hypothetical protein
MRAPVYRVDDAVVLIGDGVKQVKEGRRMPGVQKLHQESGNASKSEYIYGHLFGAVVIVLFAKKTFMCIPLFMTIQAGVKKFFCRK